MAERPAALDRMEFATPDLEIEGNAAKAARSSRRSGAVRGLRSFWEDWPARIEFHLDRAVARKGAGLD